MASIFARHGAILEVIGQCKNRKRLREAGGDELSLHSYESSQNYVTYRSRKFVQWECIPFQCAALTAQQCQQKCSASSVNSSVWACSNVIPCASWNFAQIDVGMLLDESAEVDHSHWTLRESNQINPKQNRSGAPKPVSWMRFYFYIYVLSAHAWIKCDSFLDH
jgi:hypothetical protein